MARRVELAWGAACRWRLDEGIPPQVTDNGVYQITRLWGARDESLLYIGIVWAELRTFKQRMQEHRRDWLGEFRGINFRFAEVRPLPGLTRDRALVEEIEGALVNDLCPPYNTSKTRKYSLRSDLIISSSGDRGCMPRTLNTEDHEWVGDPGTYARRVRYG